MSVMRSALAWILVTVIALIIALIIVYIPTHRYNDECSRLINTLEYTMLKVINALNYSEPYNGCVNGCTSRFYDAYQLLKNNASVLINELAKAKCSGVNVSQLSTYINYALGNLTEYNSANPLSGVDNALNNSVAAYRLLKGSG
ncbi:hypothetical protein [Caldivirga maquilingensis]|uniref:Uncharacterized protein n=1 Tax=Caldivirga maquilingensis (strain ATCC 700844 / DSM 13496 / JCM 10307 / IC-167) TaxID=397948 RepID=A8M9L8_CALMQ|nr:hypothetical protein [Caldivirga maquilingensis]ABW00899.1 hypothetical protein Cmaq_0045 [Caldivirga maquilingensis IC-167]